ncbi:MAG: hypothetical protein R2825_10460 [Saprospiraceae bacterium]
MKNLNLTKRVHPPAPLNGGTFAATMSPLEGAGEVNAQTNN